jgi:hypothetical protein
LRTTQLVSLWTVIERTPRRLVMPASGAFVLPDESGEVRARTVTGSPSQEPGARVFWTYLSS